MKKITKKINTLHKSKIGLERINAKDHSILDTAVNDLNLNVNEKNKNNFSLSKNVIDEILSLKENEILRYLVFRYKYEIFPIIKRIDNYPPYLQIEPHLFVIIDVFFVLKPIKHLQIKRMALWEKWIKIYLNI